MDYKLALLLLAGAQLSSALPAPCECTRQLQQVCGTDGQTYNNICLLNCAQAASNNRITLAKHGACADQSNTGICGCSLTYTPVCGSDGSTYPNICHISCKARNNPSLYKAYEGECNYSLPQPDLSLSDPNNCNCALDYIPVCGSDGKTYRNTCHISCKYHSNLRIAYEGECKNVNPPNVCICTEEYFPVCGSDNVTYSNDCLLNCATAHDSTLRIASKGPCGGRNPYLRSN